MDYMICKFNPKLSTGGSCKLSFLTRMQKVLNLRMDMPKTVDNMTARIQLLYKFRNGYVPLLIDVTTSVCDYLNGKREEVHTKVLGFILDAMQPYVNRSPACPYVGRFDITDMPVNMAVLNYVFLPAGNYILNLTVSDGIKDDYIWNGKIYFILPEGKTAEDDRMG